MDIKLLTLNIRHGGGKRGASIAAALREADPDVIVLTEYRSNRTGEMIRRQLGEDGWTHQASSDPPARANGVLVVAKSAFTTCPVPGDVPEGAWRWLECSFDCLGLVGTYFPLSQRKVAYWAWFLGRARERVGRPCVFMGDFNTGKHFIDEAGATFVCAEYLERMEELGYRDVWRTMHPEGREYTWYSHRGNGFRLDYAWVGPTVAAGLRGAVHLHKTRVPGVTDHAGLLIEVEIAEGVAYGSIPSRAV